MLKKSLAAGAVAAVAAGALLTGPPAYADDIVTSGDGGVLSGNQVVLGLNVPVNVCGNAVGVLGVAGASCSGSGASVS